MNEPAHKVHANLGTAQGVVNLMVLKLGDPVMHALTILTCVSYRALIGSAEFSVRASHPVLKRSGNSQLLEGLGGLKRGCQLAFPHRGLSEQVVMMICRGWLVWSTLEVDVSWHYETLASFLTSVTPVRCHVPSYNHHHTHGLDRNQVSQRVPFLGLAYEAPRFPDFVR